MQEPGHQASGGNVGMRDTYQGHREAAYDGYQTLGTKAVGLGWIAGIGGGTFDKPERRDISQD